MGLPPWRSVIRMVRLTAWTMCSGPTATHGSGGSMEFAEFDSPAKPVPAAGSSPFVVASAGTGAAAMTVFFVPGAPGVVVVAGRPRCGRVAVLRAFGLRAASCRTLTVRLVRRDRRDCVDLATYVFLRAWTRDAWDGAAAGRPEPAGAAAALPPTVTAMSRAATIDALERSAVRWVAISIPSACWSGGDRWAAVQSTRGR